MENLKLAHKNARKDKLYYKEVKMVDANEEFYLKEIQKLLIDEKYIVSDYVISIINDKGKERELCKLPYYPDRIIQWAIMLQIEFIFMEVFTNFTCASIKYRGIHKASQLLDKYMQDEEGTKYCLKVDIHKFYPNIDHAILKKLIRKKIKDKQLLALLDLIIDSIPNNKGVPIGSYLSQFLANFYLAYFDHWLKEELRIKYVIRYMDDIVILHHSKEFLHYIKKAMDEYLAENLNLTIKDNWQVFPTAIRGIDFVGYRHFYGFKLLRKSTCKRFKRKMLDIQKKIKSGKEMSYSDWCSMYSYKGWLEWCNGYRLYLKYIDPIIDEFIDYYIKNIKWKGVKTNERFRNKARKQIPSKAYNYRQRFSLC